jgi:surface polysaccharide O-acyltransferase-like enzyme
MKTQMSIRQDIEALRIISALGIVWFHAEAPGGDIAYAGLVVFLILSAYLSKGPDRTEGATFKRVQRLLVPWLVWFAIFACGNMLTGVPVFRNQGPVGAVLAGPSYHLWYMPFIFLCLVSLNALKARVSQLTMMYASCALVVLALASSPLWLAWSNRAEAPVAGYMQGAVAVSFGVFLSYASFLPEVWRRLIIVAMALAAGYFLYAAYAVGMLIGLLLTLDWLKLPPSINLTALSSCTLGIYFIHPLFLRFLPHLFTTTAVKLALATIVCSTISVWIGRRAAPRLARYWS